MGPVDTTLIEKVYSPAVGWASRLLGLDQWKLALECLNGAIAFYLAGVAFTISRKGVEDGIFVDLLSALIWLGFMQLVRTVAQRQAGSSIGRQTARMQEGIFRILLVALMPLSIYYMHAIENVCHTLSLFFFVSHLYFKACDMPPPQRRTRLAFVRG